MLGSSLASYLEFNKIKLHLKLFHCIRQYGSNWLCDFKKFCSQKERTSCAEKEESNFGVCDLFYHTFVIQ